MAKEIKQSRRNADASQEALPPAANDGAPEFDIKGHDIGRAGRIGLWIILLGFGGFLAWAAFAPLDEGVPAMGMVSIDTKRKPVQHPTGGVVKQVLVHEGSMVKEGEVVLRMDEAVARANFEAIRQQYLALRAVQARLLAEQAGATSISFQPELVAAASDPLIKKQMLTQEQLFASRRASLQAALQGIQESIRGQQAGARAYTSMLSSRRSQTELLSEQLKGMRDLVKEGYAPRNTQLDMERQLEDNRAGIADLEGNIIRAQQAVAELMQRSVQLQQDYRKEVETQLSDTSRDVEAAEQKFVALKQDLERVELKAPAAGQVVALVVQTPGTVVQGGQKLMDIVPGDEPLLMEVKVQPQVIDKVRAGLPVDVRFNTFAESPGLVADGKVISVSHDAVADAPNAPLYYLARVQLTPDGQKKMGRHVIQAGMPVDVVIKTGERSFLEYLMHPLTRRLAASMKES